MGKNQLHDSSGRCVFDETPIIEAVESGRGVFFSWGRWPRRSESVRGWIARFTSGSVGGSGRNSPGLLGNQETESSQTGL